MLHEHVCWDGQLLWWSCMDYHKDQQHQKTTTNSSFSMPHVWVIWCVATILAASCNPTFRQTSHCGWLLPKTHQQAYLGSSTKDRPLRVSVVWLSPCTTRMFYIVHYMHGVNKSCVPYGCSWSPCFIKWMQGDHGHHEEVGKRGSPTNPMRHVFGHCSWCWENMSAKIQGSPRGGGHS